METNKDIILEFDEGIEVNEDNEVEGYVDELEYTAARILSLGYQGAIRKIIHEAHMLADMVNMAEEPEIDLADRVITFIDSDRDQSREEFDMAVSMIRSLLTPATEEN